MSENPGPASPGASPRGGEQSAAPVDTGTGPNETDVNKGSTDTSADDPDEGRPDAG